MAGKDIQKLHNFLKEAETYYLATSDGEQPRVRPFGTALLFEDKIYIHLYCQFIICRDMISLSFIHISVIIIYRPANKSQEAE